MKNLTMYTIKGVVVVDKDLLQSKKYTQLTSLQTERTSFVSVVPDEDLLISSDIEDYLTFKVNVSKRANVSEDALFNEMNYRMSVLENKEIPYDQAKVQEEVYADLLRTAKISEKEFLMFYNKVSGQVLIDSTQANAEKALELLFTVIDNSEVEEYHLVTTEAFALQKVLTSYVINKNNIPEPYSLGDKITMGVRAFAGKKPKSANIAIKDEYLYSGEVLNHLNNNKVVHSIELDYDGVIFFKVDHTFKITGINFEQTLDYQENTELSEYDNFLAEYTLKITEMNKAVNILINHMTDVIKLEG